ncbi:hypothetical protein ACFWAR_31350 [Streptomyces sp. NPDC059917]|uniref:hypothetical protein n=1 Tax=Streptomyces sp. NPDC059917 TaxID=3347002 RepID=UPI00365652C3
MSIAHALRTALVTAALAGAAVLGTQVAFADNAATGGAGSATTQPGSAKSGAGPDDGAAPQAVVPSPTPTKVTNPWD